MSVRDPARAEADCQLTPGLDVQPKVTPQPSTGKLIAWGVARLLKRCRGRGVECWSKLNTFTRCFDNTRKLPRRISEQLINSVD